MVQWILSARGTRPETGKLFDVEKVPNRKRKFAKKTGQGVKEHVRDRGCLI